jgi:hypothetical protein
VDFLTALEVLVVRWVAVTVTLSDFTDLTFGLTVLLTVRLAVRLTGATSCAEATTGTGLASAGATVSSTRAVAPLA